MGNCPVGNCPSGELSEWGIVQWGIVRVGNCPGSILYTVDEFISLCISSMFCMAKCYA